MKIDYGGQVYDLDLEAVTLKQAMVIQGYVGMSIAKLFDQFSHVEEDTPELLAAVGAVYWLMKNQAGEQFPIADADFPLVPFLTAFFTALKAEGLMTAEPSGEAAVDPTSSGQAPPAVSPSLPAPSSPSPPEEVTADTTAS